MCGVGLVKHRETFHSSEQKGRGLTWSSPTSNEVDDAEGRDREQVGDEAIFVWRKRAHCV